MLILVRVQHENAGGAIELELDGLASVAEFKAALEPLLRIPSQQFRCKRRGQLGRQCPVRRKPC